MRIVIKFFYFFGLLFWGIGLFYSLTKLILLNDKFFCMENATDVEIICDRDSINIICAYTYRVNKKEYNDSYVMYADYFAKCNIDSIYVKYNASFPSISYIEGIPLKIRKQKVGIIVSSFFLIFLILLWNISNREKWIKRYGG